MLFKKHLSIFSLILCLACTSLDAAQQPGKSASATPSASTASATPLAEPTSSVSGTGKRKADGASSALASAAAAESDSQPEQPTKRLRTDKDEKKTKYACIGGYKRRVGSL